MSASPVPLRFELVREPARFDKLREPWTILWSRATASIFQSHAWIEAWWHAGSDSAGRELRIALGWRADELVAVMAFAVTRRRGLRVLEWAAKEQTDYCDALVAPDLDPHGAVRQLWAGVTAAGGYDLCYLSHLLPAAHARALLDGGRRLGLSHRGETSLRVRSDAASGDAWMNAQTKKARQNYRRGKKALGDLGTACFREIGPDEPLGPIVERLAEMKLEWLARTGNVSSVLADEAAPLKALAGVLARAGILRLFVLECDGMLVAGAINFVEGGRMMALFAAFDHAFERASVGSLLMSDYIMRAVDEGIREIDFLCGAEEYKLRFANARVDLVSAIGGRTWLGEAAVAADLCIHRARAWRRRRAAARQVQRSEGAKIGAGRLQES